MAKMRFPLVIEQDEDGMYIGTVPDIRGCHSYGATLDELMENSKEAIIANIKVLKAESKNLPKVNFSGVQQVEVEV